jgi:hypothetical protein
MLNFTVEEKLLGCLAFNLLTDESFSSPDSCSILSLLSSVNSLFISDEPSIVFGMLSYLLAFNAVNLFFLLGNKIIYLMVFFKLYLPISTETRLHVNH